MSRKSKPRKPQNTAASLALRCVDRIMFACSTVTPLRPYGGRGYHNFTTRELRVAADEIVVTSLFRTDRVWRGWACRVVQDGEKYVVDSRQFNYENYNLGDLIDDGEAAYGKLFDVAENVIGWALVVTPGKLYDFDKNNLALENHYLEEILNGTPENTAMFSTRRDIFGELLTANAVQRKNKSSGIVKLFKEGE